jgi:SAM-dependent methyltransferase
LAYADLTLGDRNPIKRWIQQRRFADALNVIRKAGAVDRLRVLDYGAGDGELIRQMSSVAPIDALVYEPATHLMLEAKSKLASLNSVVFLDNVRAVEPNSLDYVFCLEVFEHLPGPELNQALSDIHRVLKPEGLAVIGVPHEIHLPALLKGLFRMTRRHREFDGKLGNVVAAFLGRPPTDRPLGLFSAGVRYHYHHLGFDYRVFEQQLLQTFSLSARWFSPVRFLGALLNSEVYFLLKKQAAPQGR